MVLLIWSKVHQKDPLKVSVEPVIRLREKKLKDAFNGFIYSF
jgi:hypothetical protein